LQSPRFAASGIASEEGDASKNATAEQTKPFTINSEENLANLRQNHHPRVAQYWQIGSK
jgi:hypothetical protein